MARYSDAILWMALNDDTEWLDDEGSALSVTASLVADLFHKTDEAVRADLTKELARQVRLEEIGGVQR